MLNILPEETAEELNMPVWMGEWGAFYNHGESIVPVAQHAVSQIEKNLFGNTYWSYELNMDNLAYFQQAILRPYPAYTNGELLNYNYDRVNNSLIMHWQEDKDSDAPTMVFFPNISKIEIDAIDTSLNVIVEKFPNSNAGWLVIPTVGSDMVRELEVEVKE